MRMAGLSVAVLLLLGCGSASEVSREVGARCTMQDQCDERCLQGGDYPDGFCTISCDSSSDCPGGSICVDREGSVCLLVCDEPTDCEFLGAGWLCRNDDAHPGGEDVMVCRGDG